MGLVVLLLHYISVFAKHTVTLIDITEKEEDSPKVKREWTYRHVKINIFILIDGYFFSRPKSV